MEALQCTRYNQGSQRVEITNCIDDRSFTIQRGIKLILFVVCYRVAPVLGLTGVTSLDDAVGTQWANAAVDDEILFTDVGAPDSISYSYSADVPRTSLVYLSWLQANKYARLSQERVGNISHLNLDDPSNSSWQRNSTKFSNSTTTETVPIRCVDNLRWKSMQGNCENYRAGMCTGHTHKVPILYLML